MTTRNSLCSLQSDINLVEQILEQGQRLRAAMVQTILNNDPFNIDVVKTRNFKSYSETDALKPLHISADNQQDTKSLTLEDKHKFLAYLRGKQMTRSEERKALETFRTMSNADICDATERSYNSDYSCCCDTCKMYYKHNLSCDFNHSSTVLCKDRHDKVPPLNLNLNSKYKDRQQGSMSNVVSKDTIENLKYVDSLKISVHSLVLNQEGNKKVYGSSIDKKMKLPTSITHTYFIEYQIPESITKLVLRSKSKVDSGLDSHNLVRMCSKKLQNEAIYFKQISLHDITNLDQIDLSTVNIKFQVSCRTLKKKSSDVLGYAIFNIGSFLNSKHLSIHQNLLVMLNSEAPIVIGTLKVSLQLGCGQLYFGKEFIDAICSNKENRKGNIESELNVYQSDTKHHNTETSLLSKDPEFCDKNYDIVNKKNLNATESITQRSPTLDASPVKETKEDSNRLQLHNPNKETNSKKVLITDLRTHDTDKQVLFGFVCVGEAQFVKEKEHTFVTCQPFCQDDVLFSRLIHDSSNPYYNFDQVLPFVYDDIFLNKLRDNYMIFEFWEKINEQDNLIGISKVSLHQFYVAFRNPIITKYLNRNKLPVIGCDRWEPICNPLNGEVYGQVEILIALGADVQIHNLRRERGFESESVVAKSPRSSVISKKVTDNKQELHKKSAEKIEQINPSKLVISDRPTYKNKSPNKFKTTDVKRQQKIKQKSVDVAIQSEINMSDPRDNIKNIAQTQTSDILGAFLTQLLQQKQKNYVESSTNTDHKQQNAPLEQPNFDNVKIRRTSDLLESLQQALSINPAPPPLNVRNSKPADTFTAHIVVENALHLPSRTKCAAKTGKGKPRFEELLPSVYVSFETNSELKVTKIVEESKNPEWDFSCDVELQADLLTNNQKRLIFKVWKKSNNLPQSGPNFESDTVLGFAALDLTVLLAGMPTVSGWFNIIDFSNKCNGQIKISVTPLENINRFIRCKVPFPLPLQNKPPSCGDPNKISQEIHVERIDEPGEVLSRALKRKFTELDEITQRLKLRLSHVTNDESDTSNDESADEFERDINTLCVEDDYDMINFEDETSNVETQIASNALLQIQDRNFIYSNTDAKDGGFSNINSVNRNQGSGDNSTTLPSLNICTDSHNSLGFVGHLDKQLIEGRQKIDTLLEKLSLLNHNEAEVFDGRYVSGCSATQDCSNPVSDEILKDIKKNTDPISIDDVSSDNNSNTNLHTGYVTNKRCDVISSSSTCSNSELLLNRYRPDGAGNTPDDAAVKLINVDGSSSDT